MGRGRAREPKRPPASSETRPEYACFDPWALPHYPPAQNQYMQEKILEELIFAHMHVGPVFALTQIQENMFEELFLKYVFAPSQICICHFAPSLCMDTVAAFTHP